MTQPTESVEWTRRGLLGLGLGGAASAALAGAPAAARPIGQKAPTGSTFQLNYAPHFGMFRHHAGEDLVGQLEFMHAEGFRALEDNGMSERPIEEQKRIATTLQRLDMTMGVFVAHTSWGKVSFAGHHDDVWPAIEKDIRNAVEVAKRVNARWSTVVPGGLDAKLHMAYQTANVVDNLRRAAEICEPSGLVLVLEPLNHRVNHPGVFLTGIPQAYMVCRAVDSPSVKILDDLYHQQITEGHLIPNLDSAWSEVAYIQVGDNPGRKEPTTGEINYKNVFRHLHQKGFAGVVGMEHGNSRAGREGERAVIEAYREVDAFS